MSPKALRHGLNTRVQDDFLFISFTIMYKKSHAFFLGQSKTMNMVKVDIYEEGRFKGTLRVKDRWHGIVPIDEEELREEIEKRLPTLKHTKYTISFR